MREWRYSFTTLDLGARWEWSASRLCRFTLREATPDTHCIRRKVGLRADMDVMEEIKSLVLVGN
jgi:hypothetical protein